MKGALSPINHTIFNHEPHGVFEPLKYRVNLKANLYLTNTNLTLNFFFNFRLIYHIYILYSFAFFVDSIYKKTTTKMCTNQTLLKWMRFCKHSFCDSKKGFTKIYRFVHSEHSILYKITLSFSKPCNCLWLCLYFIISRISSSQRKCKH